MSTDDPLLLLKAADFAAYKHRHQRRKCVDALPYVNHPLTVARILSDIGGIRDFEVLAAAILHDTLEDTDTTPDELSREFGERISAMVMEVSDDISQPRATRKQQQVEHAGGLSDGAALIKLADKIANVRDMAGSPPADWSLERRLGYLSWAEKVILNCPPVNKALQQEFMHALAAAKVALKAG